MFVATLTHGSEGLAYCDSSLYWLDGANLHRTSGVAVAYVANVTGGIACASSTGVLMGAKDGIYAYELDGGVKSVLSTTPSPARGIARSGTNVFWINTNERLTMYDLAGDGGVVDLLPADIDPEGDNEKLAMTPDTAFSIADGGILRTSFDGDASGPLGSASAVATSETKRVFVVRTSDLAALAADGTFESLAPITHPVVLVATSSVVFYAQSGNAGFEVSSVDIATPHAIRPLFQVVQRGPFGGPAKYIATDGQRVWVATDTDIWASP